MVLGVLAVGSGFGRQAELIDFTYADVLLDVGGDNGAEGKIEIKPTIKQVEKYGFPEVCDLEDRLYENDTIEGVNASTGDFDKHIDYLKSRVITLLKLAEEIKSNRAMLSGSHAAR